MWTRWLPFLVAIIAAGCGGHSPTAPATPTLTTGASLTVARHETSQLRAQFGTLGNASDDVTAAATWTSSDPQVVTVNAGLVTAVGIGHATINVRYQDQSKVVPVTARRRVAFAGDIRLSNVNKQQRSLLGLTVWADNEQVGSLDISDSFSSSAEVILGRFIPLTDRPMISPGIHTIALVIEQFDLPDDQMYASDASSHIDIIDRDTGKRLATVPLAVQEKALKTPPPPYPYNVGTLAPNQKRSRWTPTHRRLAALTLADSGRTSARR